MATYPDWVLRHRTKGTAIHHISGHYYLYEVASEWDKAKKKSVRKTLRSLGRITPEGLQPRVRRKSADEQMIARLDKICSKEYGITHFISRHLVDYIAQLKHFFPDHWEVLICVAYCRLVFQSSLRQMPFHIGHSYLSEQYPHVALTDKKISLALRDIGRDRAVVEHFMRKDIGEGEHILLDMTHIPSKSEHIDLAQPGYNSEWNFESQFNLLYIYALQTQMPAFYRLLSGNIREVKAMSLTLKQSGVKNCTLIADKGFHSKANVEELMTEQLSFIIPLRRDNQLIRYDLAKEDQLKTESRYFQHEKRYIWHTQYQIPEQDLCVYLFLDENLKNKEQSDYLNRLDIKQKGYSIEKFHLKKREFGTIALLTNLKDKTPAEIYTAYKSRMNVENVFDAFKTVLDADKTYMQNEEVLQGWMFANHIALQWYYRLWQQLQKANQLSKYSVKDLIQHLQEIKIIKIDDKWHQAEIIKRSKTLLDKISLPLHIV